MILVEIKAFERAYETREVMNNNAMRVMVYSYLVWCMVLGLGLVDGREDSQKVGGGAR